MNGGDKILDRIKSDCDENIKAINAKAEENCSSKNFFTLYRILSSSTGLDTSLVLSGLTLLRTKYIPNVLFRVNSSASL